MQLTTGAALQRRVEKWGHEEVLRWLSNVDLTPYADTLQQRGIAGPVRGPMPPSSCPGPHLVSMPGSMQLHGGAGVSKCKHTKQRGCSMLRHAVIHIAGPGKGRASLCSIKGLTRWKHSMTW